MLKKLPYRAIAVTAEYIVAFAFVSVATVDTLLTWVRTTSTIATTIARTPRPTYGSKRDYSLRIAIWSKPITPFLYFTFSIHTHLYIRIKYRMA